MPGRLGQKAKRLPVPLSCSRSMLSSTCSTSCRPCSSKPSMPSPPRTSSTSRSCTSSWPGEVPAGCGRSCSSYSGTGRLRSTGRESAQGSEGCWLLTWLLPFPVRTPGGRRIVPPQRPLLLLPGIPQPESIHAPESPLPVSGSRVRLLVCGCQMRCTQMCVYRS